jgi:hypothetical protein
MTMMVTEDRDVLGAATGVIDLQRDHGFGRRQEPAVQVLDIDRSRGPAATLERRRERLGQEKRAGRETALDREVVSSLVSDRRGACSVAVDAIDALTVRERETLELIAQGRSNASCTCPPPTMTIDACSRCSRSCASSARTAQGLTNCNYACHATGRAGSKNFSLVDCFLCKTAHS